MLMVRVMTILARFAAALVWSSATAQTPVEPKYPPMVVPETAVVPYVPLAPPGTNPIAV